MAPPSQVSVWAPAKINLALHVTGQRDDGYHLLETLAVFTRFGDTIEIMPASEDSFHAFGPYSADVPVGRDNIVAQARDLFKKGTDLDMPTAITLEKRLPVASGIGGGSSDAAATLIALNTLAGTDMDAGALAELGTELGADVAMCVHRAPLVAKNIGDLVTAVRPFPRLHVVLVNSGVQISTPRVFSGLTNRANSPLPKIPSQFATDELDRWLAATRNDLTAAAVRLEPEIETVAERLVDAGARFARMSGSGATCFGIFDNAQDASQAAATIADRQPGWFVVATETTAHGDQYEPD